MKTDLAAACRADGSSTLDDSGFVLSPDLMTRDVERLPPGSVGRIHCGSNETHITIKPPPIGGMRLRFNLRFKDDRLWMIEMMAENKCVPEVMAADGAWSRENELTRTRIHEAWAANVLGLEFAIKPWVDPDLPEPVMPAFPGFEHPRNAEYSWSEIGSYMDEKGCAASLIVSYA